MAGIPEARMGSCHSVASLLADRLSLAAAAGEGDGGPSGTPIYVQYNRFSKIISYIKGIVQQFPRLNMLLFVFFFKFSD